MTPTVMMSNLVAGADGAAGVDGVVLVTSDHGGLGTHVVGLEAGHTHWDTGMRSEQVCMVAAVVWVSPGRVCISANSIGRGTICTLSSVHSFRTKT